MNQVGSCTIECKSTRRNPTFAETIAVIIGIDILACVFFYALLVWAGVL